MEQFVIECIIEAIKDKLPTFVKAWDSALCVPSEDAAVELALAIWAAAEHDEGIKELLK